MHLLSASNYRRKGVVKQKNHINFFSPSSRSQITSCYCYIHCELCYARQLLSRAARRREEQKK
nr:MAG TPA: hypothetical protein [Caudoviricetes sp.]